MKKVNKNQFNRWTAPSKASFLGYKLSKKSYVLGVIGFILTLFFGILYGPISAKIERDYVVKVKKELLELNKEKDWQTMAVSLSRLESSYGDADWYNFYSGICASDQKLSVSNFKAPEYYLNKISSESEYFDRSIIQLLFSYFKLRNKQEYEKKVGGLVSRLESINYESPEYFMVLFTASKHNYDNERVMKSYQLIKQRYPEIFIKKAGTVHFEIKKKGVPVVMNLDKFAKLCGVSFRHAYELIARNDANSSIIRDLKIMYPNQESFTFALMGMDRLRIKMSQNDRGKYREFMEKVRSLGNEVVFE